MSVRTSDRRHLARTAAAAFALLALTAAQAAAQGPAAGTAKALFAELISNRLIDSQGTAGAAGRTQDLIDEFSKSIAIGVGTAPVGASSAGFTYEFDSSTGERTLRSQSFGPLFVERPLTNGKGVFNVGANFTYVDYQKFLGDDLNNRGIQIFDNRVRFLDTNFEQFITEYIAVKPTVSTMNAVASYGLTRSLDVGIVIPFSTIDIDARRYWDYDISRSFPFLTGAERAAYGGQSRGTNFVPEDGNPNTGTVSASGVGDITLRAKYAFGASTQRAAFILDTRLPTGNADNFLGTGKTSVRGGFSAAAALSSTVSVNANAGFRTGGLTDEGDYGIALDAALLSSRKLTASLEFFGQYLSEAINGISQIQNGPIRLNSSLGGQPVQVTYQASEPVFDLGSVSVLRGAAAVKYNIAGKWLLTAGVLFPLNDTGLTGSTTAFIGFDLSLFGK